MSGRYVALEGIEGAGKSTVARRLGTHLEGRAGGVVAVREPGGTPAGEAIRAILLDGAVELGPWAEALLFSAARAQLAREVIAPALQRGDWVVGDRSVYSSLAYQGGGRGLGIDAVRAVNEPGLDGVWPDLVVLLRVGAAAGLERQEVQDRIGAEGYAFQSLVAATFDELAAREPDRFLVVAADGPLEVVVGSVIDGIEERWPQT